MSIAEREGSGRATGQSWAFTLTSDPITSDEQALFDGDLERLRVDRNVWNVLNTVLQTGTRFSRPLVVRAYDGTALIGMALVFECRRTGEMFFDPPISTFMDLPGVPMVVWMRHGITVDHCGNPGFVVERVDRQDFVERAIAFLSTRYMLGAVIEFAESPARPGGDTLLFPDIGVIDAEGLSSIDDYLAQGRNLRRKTRKFANKGGAVRVIEGPMPRDLHDAAIQAFDTLEIRARMPFQDNYVNMARAITSLDAAHMVHFVALLDEEYAGHQSFCRSGDALHCQSGAFDRRRNSTYHAYENIIVASVGYMLSEGLRRADYGPVFNETKKKMMTGFIQAANRTFTRHRPVARLFPRMVRRSKIAPERFAPYVGLGDEAQTRFI